MNMHEHDQELIMALAAGSLGGAEASAAMAEISSCPECSRDLELQRVALSALGELPQPYLTATESSRLHTDLKRELGLHKQAPAPARNGIAWGRWLPALGIAAVFLVAIVSLATLGVGGDSADSATMDMTTTTAAASETTAAALAPRAEVDDGAGDLYRADEVQSGGLAETTTAAETTTTAAAAQEATTTPGATETTSSGSKNAFELLPPFGMIEDLNRSDLIDLLTNAYDMVQDISLGARASDPTVDGCLIENSAPEAAVRLGLPESSQPILLGTVADAATGEEFLLVAYVPADINQTVFATQRMLSCDIVTILFQ
jgi:hypothetical protein